MREQTKRFLILSLWLTLFMVLQAPRSLWGFETEQTVDVEDHISTASGAVLDLDAGTDLQTSPNVAWNLSCDKFLVVYDRKRTDVDYNIWGRYVAGTGLALGAGPFQITSDGMKQQAPAVAYNEAAGNYLIAWHDNRHGSYEIYAQLWNCQKLPVNDPVRITRSAGHSLNPDVICGYSAVDPVCWVVWEDFRDGNWNIYGQRLDATGVLAGGNVQLTTDAGVQRSPAIARNPDSTGCNPDGTFFVVWHDNRNTAKGYGYDIYGQQLDNAGPCGINKEVYIGKYNQMNPDIAYGTVNDRYHAVWEDNRSGDWDVYGRMLLPSGTSSSANFALSDLVSSQLRASIAYDNANNQFLTVWQDRGAGNPDIRGRRTSGLGVLLGGGTVIATPADETSPAVAFGATSDHYFTVWEDSTLGIRGRAIWP